MDFRAAATSWWTAATPSGRRVSCPCFTARCTPKVSPGCWRGWRLPSAADRVRGQGAWLEELRQALFILDVEYPVWTLPPSARVCQLGFRPWVQRSLLLHPGCGRWGRWAPGHVVTAPSAECEATGSDAELCVSHVRLKTCIVHMVTTVPKRWKEPPGAKTHHARLAAWWLPLEVPYFRFTEESWMQVSTASPPPTPTRLE